MATVRSTGVSPVPIIRTGETPVLRLSVGNPVMPRAATKKAPTIQYSVHPGVAMVMKWVAELKEKTGRSLEEWCEHIAQDGPDELAARRDWLKRKYKLGTNMAGWLAERADGQPTWDESPEAYLAIAPTYVDEMFAEPKAGLRPVADALMHMALAVAPGVKFSPCKTIIPFYNQYVVAQIKPATRTRIDFGLALGPAVKFTARLKDTGGLKKKDRITHKVEIGSIADIDADVKKWFKAAFDRDNT